MSGRTTTWSVAITCPRPSNRASDDFHVRPEKVTGVATRWFGSGTTLTLTLRRVHFRMVGTAAMPDLCWLTSALASLLNCLSLRVTCEAGVYRLPVPVRTDIRVEEVGQ